MSSLAYEQKKWVSKDQTQRVLFQDTNRAYTAEDVMKALKLASPKDPEKQSQVLDQIASCLTELKNEAVIREVAPNLLKVRLYFDKEKSIEHAYIGGMGNTFYRFNALIFRLNIGVLSILFVRNENQKNWRVAVADPTIGRNYSMVKPLCDGIHVFGTAPTQVDGKSGTATASDTATATGWVIDGKYIDKTHTTITLSGNNISVVDHRTLRGTRIDHLTETGFADYLNAASRFLKSTDGPRDIVKRGRFALEQLLHDHRNFELSFLNAAIDFILLKESK